MIKKKIRLFTAAAVILLMSCPAFMLANGNKKRAGSISGALRDVYSQQVLAGAEVTLEKTEKTTISDSDGKFVFKEVPVGSYSLRFDIPGMQPQIRTDIIVKSLRTTTVNAAIELIPQEDESVSVTAGYFTSTPDQPANHVNFSSEEIRRAPGSAGDVSRIIASLPSIAQVSDQTNNLIVRGGSSHENLYLVDNIPVPNINHFPFQGTTGGAVSLINVDFIENVEFSAGGFSAIYGNRLSSVMNLSLREGNRENFNGQLSLDFSGAGLSVEGPLPGKKDNENRGSWMFSARRSYLDLLTNLMDAGASVQYSDIQGKLTYNLSDRSKITVLGILGMDKSNVSREDATDLGESTFGVSKSHEHTVGLNWFLMWSDKGYSNTSFSHSLTTFDNDFRKTAADSFYLGNDSEEESLHFRNVNNYIFNHRSKLTFGVEGELTSSRYNYITAPYTDPLGQQVAGASKQIDVSAHKASIFAEYTLTPFSGLSFNLGLRGDYFSYTGKTSVSPRGSLALQLSNR
ncbi:MAG: TonB-dependent receptor, partial [Desulfobacteraceae bacterium]|nr:TonB-dependent receptor [Desulfobacteraceae bacterium]